MYPTVILYLLLSYTNVFQAATTKSTDVLCGTVAEGACIQKEAKVSTCSDRITQYGEGVDDNCYDQYDANGQLVCVNALSAAVCPVEGDACSGCVTMGMPSVQCPDGINMDGPIGCTWQRDGNVLFCADKLVSCPCTTNDDCFSDEWCRVSCDDPTLNQCAPYVIEGGYCGGFTMQCMVEQCPPEMSCVDMYPNIVDEQGICTVLCETDGDCASDEWCRAILNNDNTCNTEKQCVSFAAEGESCGGKVMPCYLEICAAGMTCLDMDPNIVDEPGVCGQEAVSCRSDDDCASDQWCRVTCDDTNVNECVSYAIEGENCGGFTPLCNQLKCPPEMSCVDMYPTMMDEPGSCTVLCETDGDCGTDQWCRAILNEENTCNTEKQCVSYVAEGANCGGKVMACYLEKCVAGMTCLDMEPNIVDEPGVCGEEAVSCNIDDCGSDEWCRVTCDDTSVNECVPYAIEGEKCGGMSHLACNVEKCAPEISCLDTSICGKETVPLIPCSSDDDCESDEWCRVTCDDDSIKECVPYAVSGESCAGFTLACAFEKCLPKMACLQKDPSIADLPGVCCQDGYTVTEDGECIEIVDEDCEVFGLEPAEVKETICSVCFRKRDEISSGVSKRICRTIARFERKVELPEGTIDEAKCMLEFCKTQNKDLNCDLEFVVLRDDIKTIDDFISEEDCNCGAFVCDDQPILISMAGNLGIFIGIGVVFAIFGWM